MCDAPAPDSLSQFLTTISMRVEAEVVFNKLWNPQQKKIEIMFPKNGASFLPRLNVLRVFTRVYLLVG